MSFTQKHSDATKQKISEAMSGRNHPRYGEEWSDEQRLKFQLTIYNKQREEKLLKNFLIQYNDEWQQFQISNKQ